jgi:Mn2+/Fe2+ NRAMP family transporter
MNEETRNNFSSLAQLLNIASILSFVSIAITLIILVFGINKFSGYGMGDSANYQMIVNIIVLIFTLFLNILLFNAAKNLKLGTDNEDQGSFNAGLEKLASYFKIIGIILVIFLGLLAIIFLFGILFGAASSFK